MYGGPPGRGWNQPPPGQGYGQRQPLPQQGYGGGGGGYGRPQQQQQQPYHQYLTQQQPRLPNRPGLGSANGPHGQGSYGSPNQQPLGAPPGSTFQLFVGSLAAGVDDGWLEKVLGVAGPVLSLRRPTPAFAFVEYGDPESVLRCLEVVNGAEICPPEGQPKALLVKADEKTRERLNEYEATREKTESHADALAQAQSDLLAILSLIRSGATPSSSANPAAPSAAELAAARAAELQELGEELPEENREIITGEIAHFRERMEKVKAKKAEEARQREAQIKAMAARSAAPSPPAVGAGRFGSTAQDPQSYNKPIGFVAQGGASGGPSRVGEVPAEPVVTDVEKEKLRVERVAREAEALFRDRERRYEQRERTRIAGVERERARERQLADQEDRERRSMAERLANWDDEREADRGRELYYSDRQRWRAQRQAARQRELEADERDRQAEEAQLASLSKQADDFLTNALPDLKPSAVGRGDGTPGGAGVKVSFGAGASKPVAKAAPVVRAPVMGLADEEDEVKKKRELIPLSYSDDEDDEKKPKAKGGLTEEEVLANVPEDQAGLWAWNVKWNALSQKLVDSKVAPFTSSLIVESLGEAEPELLSAVTEHVLAHKGAAELADELEAVLDEEAALFVTKIWRVLVNETEVAAAGLA